MCSIHQSVKNKLCTKYYYITHIKRFIYLTVPREERLYATSFGMKNKKPGAFNFCYLIVLRLAGRYAIIRLDGADFSHSLYGKLLICLDCVVDFTLNFLVCW